MGAPSVLVFARTSSKSSEWPKGVVFVCGEKRDGNLNAAVVLWTVVLPSLSGKCMHIFYMLAKAMYKALKLCDECMYLAMLFSERVL